MLLPKVERTVVASMSGAHGVGPKLLLVRPQFVEDDHRRRSHTRGDTKVAADSVGAGMGVSVVMC